MTAVDISRNWAGHWAGTNRLWLMPGDPARESESRATIEHVARERALTVRYEWSDEGQKHEGLLVVRPAAKPGTLMMAWIDSFHTGGGFQLFDAEAGGDGRLTGRGSYPAPEGPDWGWRITLTPDEDGSLMMLMDNITPEGEEARAVEAIYRRGA